MPTVSVRKISAYQIAPVAFAALILFVVSLAVPVLRPKPATLLVNVSVLKTAPVAFAVLILFVASLAESVVLMRAAIAMAHVFLPVSNGYALRVELSRWVLMMGTLMKGQFIV